MTMADLQPSMLPIPMCPVSTEQILHPEKYPPYKPIPVELPDLSSTLGADWVEIERNVMGEWYTYLILAHGKDASFRDLPIKPRYLLQKAGEGTLTLSTRMRKVGR